MPGLQTAFPLALSYAPTNVAHHNLHVRVLKARICPSASLKSAFLSQAQQLAGYAAEGRGSLCSVVPAVLAVHPLRASQGLTLGQARHCSLSPHSQPSALLLTGSCSKAWQRRCRTGLAPPPAGGERHSGSLDQLRLLSVLKAALRFRTLPARRADKRAGCEWWCYLPSLVSAPCLARPP